MPRSAPSSSMLRSRAGKRADSAWGRFKRISAAAPPARSAPGTKVQTWAATADLTASLCSTPGASVMVSTYPQPYCAFSSSGEPTAATCPLAMIATRSASRSASSRKCVVSTMTRSRLCARMTSQLKRRAYGSMPLVGSSRNTTRGSPMKAIASDNLRRCPPESALAGVSIFAPRSTERAARTASAAATAVEGAPLMRAKISKCSRTVMLGHRISNCGQRPSERLMAPMSSDTESPSMSASPWVGCSMPVRSAMVVVLPAPLWPRRAVTSPACIDRSTPSTATLSPNTFVRFWMCTPLLPSAAAAALALPLVAGTPLAMLAALAERESDSTCCARSRSARSRRSRDQ
mmetsp:Transcript_8624/g.35138  ORF Transcript_8624/g.35138 Transcript_8624/m.35138 type:complete len:347 (-) Transcript_8624:1963-3003(-)